MSSFKNRLTAQAAKINLNKQDQKIKKSKPLIGKKLLDYLEKHKEETNGDDLCIGAGYGDYTETGEPICRFELFTSELINARKAQHIETNKTNAKKEIISAYSIENLNLIAQEGCVSGAASAHLQLTENEQFFDKHSKEIKDLLEDHFGDGYIEKSIERYGGEHSHWKHRAVWRFIEIIAMEELGMNKSI